MMPSLSSLILSVSAAAPAAALPAAPPCVDETTNLLQRKEFASALTAAEHCLARTEHPRSLYLAGVAHLALGQHAQAILVLQRYLAEDARGEPERLRAIADSRLEQAKTLAVPVLLRIVPAIADGEASVVARHEADERAPIQTPIASLKERAGGRVLWLDPGAYQVTVRVEGRLPATRSVTVDVGTTELVFNALLQRPVATPAPPPPSPPPAPPFPRRRWLALTGAAGGMQVVTGLSMVALGWVRSTQQLDMGAANCMPILALDRCRDRLARGVTLRGAGAGLLGAGLGTLVGGLTALVPRPARRELAWKIEVGVGGGMLLAGAVLLGGLRGFNHLNTDASPDALLWEARFKNGAIGSAGWYALGGGLVGAGIGLGASAALGLLVQQLVPARSAAAWPVRSQGLAIAF